MAIPTISSAEATDATTLVVTFSVAVAIADLTGITIDQDGAVSVESVDITDAVATFTTGTMTYDDLTISFASDNTVTAVSGGESLAETLLEDVTNSLDTVPVIVTAVATNSTTIVVTFNGSVQMTDLTGISVSDGENIAVISAIVDTTTIAFNTGTINDDDTVTISFTSANTISSDPDDDGLVEALLEAVTNSISGFSDADLQASARIHTAVDVLAQATKDSCVAACG